MSVLENWKSNKTADFRQQQQLTFLAVLHHRQALFELQLGHHAQFLHVEEPLLDRLLRLPHILKLQARVPRLFQAHLSVKEACSQ